jgi:hypothetical protein
VGVFLAQRSVQHLVYNRKKNNMWVEINFEEYDYTFQRSNKILN